MLWALLICPMFQWATLKKINFNTALNNGLISSKAISRGSHQGFCMEVTVKNLSPDSLEVTLEPGLKLNSEKETDQDIIVIRQAIFTLSKGKTLQQSVFGFCCQAHNASPSKGAKYNFKSKPDEKLRMLANYLSTTNHDDETMQRSIWAISDSNQTASIGAHKNLDSNITKLRQLVSHIKGEPIPDYMLVQKTYVLPNGRLYTINVALKGNISYNNPTYQYCYLKMYNAQNQQVNVEIGQWIDGTHQGNYNFDVPAKTLSKGTYTLKLEANNKILGEKKVMI